MSLSLLLAAVVVTLDVQPRTFTVPATLTVTWSSTNASDCTAAGGWNGAKAASGTEQVQGSEGATSFYLDCVGSPAPVTVSWKNPTTNTDGSPYTNPKQSEVYRASTAAGLPSASAIVVPASATSYAFTGLTAGTHHFGVKAVSLTGAKSELSASVSGSVPPSPNGTAPPVTVTGTGEEPPPPTGVVSIAVDAYAVKASETLLDYVLDGKVGTVEIGVPCDALRQMGSTSYYAVNRAKYVTWTTSRRPRTAVAKCATPGELTSQGE